MKKSKSKVKSQKSKVKSYGSRWRGAFLTGHDLCEAHTDRIETLLTFDFCLLTFDLPFTRLLTFDLPFTRLLTFDLPFIRAGAAKWT
jgi:hypothetical protein